MIEYKESQPIAYQIIDNSIKKNRLVHAYIIETKGFSKGLDFAISFAKALICPNYLEKCENCNICKMIDDNNYPELRIINPDGYWIKKEQLLNLKEEFNKKTIIGTKKVYIINKAERLNTSSSNTILKFLEEPEDGVFAILVVNNVYNLIDTVSSRCQLISLNGQNVKEEKTLFKVGELLSDNELDYNNFINDEKNEEKILALINFIKFYEANGKKILLRLNDYWFNYFNDKESMANAMLLMIYYYKDVLNYKMAYEVKIFNDYIEEIKNTAKLNDLQNLCLKITKINNCRQYIDNNANLTLLIDRLIIELEINNLLVS